MEESQPPPPAQPDFAVFADDDAPAALPSPQTDRNFEIFSDESSSKPEAAAPASARRPLGAKLIDVDTPMAAVRKPTIGLTPLRPGLTPLAPAAGPAGAPLEECNGRHPAPARAPLQGFTPRPAPKLNGAGGGATIAAVASTASALAPIQPPALCHQESSAEKLPSPTINTKAALMDLMGDSRGRQLRRSSTLTASPMRQRTSRCHRHPLLRRSHRLTSLMIPRPPPMRPPRAAEELAAARLPSLTNLPVAP